MKQIKWDEVDWSNTHLECASGQYHLGIVDNENGRFVALAVNKDSMTPSIILLSDDDVDEFSKMLRQTAKSL